MCWYQFLNYFFFAFHTLLIFFNTLGWIFRRTRKWNLITLLLTAFSWFVLGIWNGWGYCLCTDWHWRVRDQMGYNDTTNSYIQFLTQQLTGTAISARLTDAVTAIVFFASIVLSVWLNVKDWRLKKKYCK